MGQEDARFESESRFFPMMHFTRGKVLTGADQAGGRVQQGRWSLRVYTLHQPGEGGLRMRFCLLCCVAGRPILCSGVGGLGCI